MTRHLYRACGPAYELRSWDADRLMRWCARDLYLLEQPISWHEAGVPEQPGKLWSDVVGPGRIALQPEKRAGWVDWDEQPGIAVVAGQSEVEMLRTIGHEMYHRYEIAQGRDPLDHGRAEAYGRRVASDYLARRIP